MTPPPPMANAAGSRAQFTEFSLVRLDLPDDPGDGASAGAGCWLCASHGTVILAEKDSKDSKITV